MVAGVTKGCENQEGGAILESFYPRLLVAMFFCLPVGSFVGTGVEKILSAGNWRETWRELASLCIRHVLKYKIIGDVRFMSCTLPVTWAKNQVDMNNEAEAQHGGGSSGSPPALLLLGFIKHLCNLSINTPG